MKDECVAIHQVFANRQSGNGLEPLPIGMDRDLAGVSSTDTRFGVHDHARTIEKKGWLGDRTHAV